METMKEVLASPQEFTWDSGLVRQAHQKMNRGQPYEEVLTWFFDSLRRYVPFDRMGIALLDATGKVLKNYWVSSLIPVQNLARDYEAPIAGSSLEKLLLENKPRVIEDLEEYARLNPQSISTKLIINDGIRSSLTCPLISEGRPIGVVFFSSCGARTYDPNLIRFFSQMAEEVSIIVQLGKMHRFFEDSQKQERTLAMVLHDLRSPIGIIRGILEILAEEDWFEKLSVDSKELFRALDRNAHSMTFLISDLADINRLSSGNIELNVRPVELKDFIDGIVVDQKVTAMKKNIILMADIKKNLPCVAWFDSQRIRQVLENLLSNAIKFSKPWTMVTFRVEKLEGELVFSVEDQGPGIPSEEIPKLFQQFSRTSVRPTANESSTGLGLYIVKKIAELHGGRATVESKVGFGSRFSVAIPWQDIFSKSGQNS